MTGFRDGSAPMTCGEMMARIVPRKGYESAACGSPGCLLDVTGAVWYWELAFKTVAKAAISLPKLNAGCCQCTPRKWRDEIEFYRVNPSTGLMQRKFVGPVTDVLDNNVEGVLTLFAADRSTWNLTEKLMPTAVTGIQEAAEDRFVRLWNTVDRLDPSCLELCRVGDYSGISISDDVAQWASLETEFAKLAGFGVCWAVMDDKLFFGNLAELQYNGLIDPAVHWEGNGALILDSGATTTSMVVVKTEEFSVAWPKAIVPDPCEGLHIRTITPEFELSESQALAYAMQQFERRSQQGLQVTTSVDSSVSQEWPVPMCDMVPGGIYEVDTSDPSFCLETRTMSQFSKMTVEGIGCEEKAVKVELLPESGVVASI